jgi:hypothetical protein
MKIIVMHCSKGRAQKNREAHQYREYKSKRNREEQFEILREVASRSFKQIDVTLLKFRKYRVLISLAYTAFLVLLPGPSVLASGGADGGVALLKLMQQGSFWVGLGVVVWGIVEAQLDLPGWKGRILKGILGYIAILLVPMLFISLRDNLQIDVWQKLKG